jgi:hypothetical protein
VFKALERYKMRIAGILLDHLAAPAIRLQRMAGSLWSLKGKKVYR